MGGKVADVPVFLCMPNVADALFASLGTDAMEMRRRADAGGGVQDLGVELSLSCSIDRTPVTAETWAPAARPRRVRRRVRRDRRPHGPPGDGTSSVPATRSHRRQASCTPARDDNASGTAGILLIADWMARRAYAAAPDDADLRSVLFIAFSAEESGLNGAHALRREPDRGHRDRHALMMNFDMIGRIKNKRLGVFGVGTPPRA